MSFICYAQNFEDVVLWRALKNIDHGFYIDIGAQDPVVDSVSYAFYQRGWQGVHVEPTRQYATKLRDARPSDIVEQIAIGNSAGSITFYEIKDTGLSTALPELAERHRESGYTAHETEVPVVTMDTLLDRYSDKIIHWLKLDIEGYEEKALESWQVSNIRPWILVIESSEPLTQKQIHCKWEDIILNKGYQFAYFDGLNRFYVHCDHCELLPLLSAPPNFFDDFVLSATHPFCHLVAEQANEFERRANMAEAKAKKAELQSGKAEAKARKIEMRAEQVEAKVKEAKLRSEQAEAKAREAELRAGVAEAKAREAETRAGHLQATLAAIYNSRLWRITAPWRWVGNVVRWFLRGSIAWLSFAPMSRPRRIVRKAVISLKLYISSCPRLKAFVIRWLVRYPRLMERLNIVGNNVKSASPPPIVQGPENLSSRARQIYCNLKTAIKQCKEERL